MRTLGLLCLTLFFSVALTTAADLDFKASVDRTGMSQDDVLTYSLVVSGSSGASPPDPQLPDFDQFRIVGGPSSQTSIQMVNLQFSSAKTVTVQLAPQAAGDLKIGPAHLSYGGKTYESKSFVIKVNASGGARPGLPGGAPGPGQAGQPGPAGQPPPQAAGQPQLQSAPDQGQTDEDIPVSVTGVADKEKAYVGEQVTVEYTLFTQRGISNLSIQSMPGTSGFWVEDLNSPQRLTTTKRVIKGQEYAVALLKRLALFPNVSGKQAIEPMTLQMSVQVPSRTNRTRNRQRSMFEDFFNDDFFGNPFAEMRTIIRRSPTLEIAVLPLPEAGKPANFTGAVGTYSITSGIDKTQVEKGQAVTYTVTIGGNGNIKTVAVPSLATSDDFRVYDPKTEDKSWIDGDVYRGEKKCEFVMIPKKEGTLTIPAVSYSFFDPKANQYRQIGTKPVVLTVTPGQSEPEPSSYVVGKVDKKEIVVHSKDIRYIKTVSGVLQTQSDAVSSSVIPWFFLLPAVVIPVAFFYNRHQVRLIEDKQYARNRTAEPLAKKYLRHAEKVLPSGDVKQFYDALADSILSFIANKLNRPRPGLTLDVLLELLKEREVPTELQEQLRSFMSEADLARFTPSGFTPAAMKNSLQTARQWLNAVIKGKYLEGKRK